VRNPSTGFIEISINEPMVTNFEIDAAVATGKIGVKHKPASLRACEWLFDPQTNTTGHEPKTTDC
jgi:hypothetical protein